MAKPIKTTGTTTDPISTDHEPPESVRQWVERHDDAVLSATPSGNKLTTTWASSAGDQSKSTTRNPGESDEDFRARHVSAYVQEMVAQPPVT